MRRRERRSVVVFVRGVAFWIAILGLGYLELALALVDARHSLGYYVARFSTYPIEVMPIELPWPISETQVVYGAAVLAGLAWLSAVLLLAPDASWEGVECRISRPPRRRAVWVRCWRHSQP
jgi:hypothetical protein